MRMLLQSLLVVLFVFTAHAQEQAPAPLPAPPPQAPATPMPPKQQNVQRIYALETSGQPENLLRIIQFAVPDADIQLLASDGGGSLLGISAPEDRQVEIDELLAKYDTPRTSSDVLVTVYFVHGSQDMAYTTVPSHIKSVTDRLSGEYLFKSAQLVETAVLRLSVEGVGDDRHHVSGVLPVKNPVGESVETLYHINIELDPFSADESGPVFARRFSVEMEIPYAANRGTTGYTYDYRDLGIETSFHAEGGELVFVGKLSPDGSVGSSLYLLARVDLLDETALQSIPKEPSR
ncbi:MAG: hypothetical protein KJ052_10110 [Candidatus Hydrogenedentes bacterium]|nr:hypothetical protein [Candidatus Hydrogenedentota bacterium]